MGQGLSEKQDCSRPTPSRSGPAAQRSLLHMLIRLIGQQTFRAALVQHKGAESAEHPLCAPPASSTSKVPHHREVDADIIITQSPEFTLGPTLGVVHLVGVDNV